jgi:hypothetical protein
MQLALPLIARAAGARLQAGLAQAAAPARTGRRQRQCCNRLTDHIDLVGEGVEDSLVLVGLEALYHHLQASGGPGVGGRQGAAGSGRAAGALAALACLINILAPTDQSLRLHERPDRAQEPPFAGGGLRGCLRWKAAVGG